VIGIHVTEQKQPRGPAFLDMASNDVVCVGVICRSWALGLSVQGKGVI
jgi:hypothetical protein